MGLLAPDPHPTGELLTGQARACVCARNAPPASSCVHGSPPRSSWRLWVRSALCLAIVAPAQVGYMLVGMKDTRSGKRSQHS